MTPQQRAQFIDAAATAWGYAGDDQTWSAGREITRHALDDLTAAGFSISLDSVRDHTNCETCEGTLEWPPHHRHPDAQAVDDLARIPCPGGSPVVWAAPPDPESETP